MSIGHLVISCNHLVISCNLCHNEIFNSCSFHNILLCFDSAPSGAPVAFNNKYARELRKKTNVIAIGVNGTSSNAELQAIASSSEMKIMAPSYSALNSVVDQVNNIVCDLAKKNSLL